MTEELRLLVTGSRFIRNDGRRLLRDELDGHLAFALGLGKRLVVVQGECEQGGFDKEAALWGHEMERAGQPVRVEGHPARNHPTQDFGPWPGAGPNRNTYMVGLGAYYCLAMAYACNSIWCRRPDVHSSHGTVDCVRKAKAARIPFTFLELWKT